MMRTRKSARSMNRRSRKAVSDAEASGNFYLDLTSTHPSPDVSNQRDLNEEAIRKVELAIRQTAETA